MCKQVASLFRVLFGSALNRALVNRRCRMWRTSVNVNVNSQGGRAELKVGRPEKTKAVQREASIVDAAAEDLSHSTQ